jgi:hypothetical protein
LTWFRPDGRIHWLDAADPALAATAGALVAGWLAAHSAQPD